MKMMILATGLLIQLTSAYAETQTPWFGSESTKPQQIKVDVLSNQTSDNSKPQDCAILDCGSVVKIAKPEQKAAVTP